MTRRLIPAIVGPLLLTASAVAMAEAPASDKIVRHAMPDSDFPISRAVAVGADATTLYLSGTVPPVIDKAADENSPKAYGDTETQTRNVLEAIAGKLEDMGYSMGDVVKMHAYITPDPDSGDIDFKGFMNAYTEFFGTEAQPNLPARTAVPVAQLVNPAWRVEIEVTAAR